MGKIQLRLLLSAYWWGVSAFLLYIIEMIIMYKAYGMPYINAPLISLTYMNTAKVFRNITISQYMLILMVEEILFAVAVGLENSIRFKAHF